MSGHAAPSAFSAACRASDEDRRRRPEPALPQQLFALRIHGAVTALVCGALFVVSKRRDRL